MLPALIRRGSQLPHKVLNGCVYRSLNLLAQEFLLLFCDMFQIFGAQWCRNMPPLLLGNLLPLLNYYPKIGQSFLWGLSVSDTTG